jgi:hypothetical protein
MSQPTAKQWERRALKAESELEIIRRMRAMDAKRELDMARELATLNAEVRRANGAAA